MYEAKRIAVELRNRYQPDDIGEVHGYMATEERAVALLRRFSVGTTTINETYFEVRSGRIENAFEQVIRLEGLTIAAENIYLRTSANSINAQLEKKALNCWVSERNGFKLSDSLHLPPLFAIYPLRAFRTNGTYYQWSIAFGLDAFLLASLPLKRRRVAGIRSDNTAIII